MVIFWGKYENQMTNDQLTKCLPMTCYFLVDELKEEF